MKNLIQTTGSFMFVDPTTSVEIHPHRPTVSIKSEFVNSRVARGDIRVLSAELSDEATDAEFGVFLQESEGDIDLAVTAFIAKFGPQVADPDADAKAKAEAEAKAKADAKAAAAAKPAAKA